MLKHTFYGINLIIGILICFAMLFFPVFEFNPDKIYKHHQEEIDAMIAFDTNVGESYEEKKEKYINEVIYNCCIALQMYRSSNDVVYDEDGNIIDSGNDNEAMMLEIYQIKEDGIKLTDITKSIKNTIKYDINLFKAMKDSGNINWGQYFEYWTNPLLTITLALIWAFQLGCGIFLIIRSVKGVKEKPKTNILGISIFGIISVFVLIMIPVILKKDLSLMSVDSINSFVRLFAMSINVSMITIGCGIGYLIACITAIVSKILKY